MRFEIGPGGGFVILVGLLGLSAAVFFLGMISGREIAQSEQGQSQLASVYPMPAGAPPAAPPQAAAPTAPAAATAKPVAQTASAAPFENTPPAAKPKPAPRHKTPPRPTLASVPLTHPSAPAAEESDTDSSAPSDSSASSDDTDTDSGGGAASAPVPRAGTHGKGYNIVIDAAMDRGAANRMAARLLGLGYTSHLIPTQINGQTWYRVQVGPYPSADDARAAQAQLRAAYTARYVNRAGATSTGSSTDTGTSDSGAADTDSSDDSGGGGASAPSD
jgi:septal ring-binding cell division protein DamX